MKLIAFAGSLRTDSLNKKFAREAARVATEAGAECEFVDLREYAMPVYDGDIEASSGIPEGAKKLGAKIRAADGLIIATPEYNGSIPGVLKNVVDWLSRDKPNMSLAEKHLLLLAASPGALGGIRALWHTRQPFDVLKVHTYPDMMALPNAANAFGADGKLSDEKTAARLKELVGQFVAFVGR